MFFQLGYTLSVRFEHFPNDTQARIVIRASVSTGIDLLEMNLCLEYTFFMWCLGGSVSKRPTSARVMISRFVSSNLASGSVLTAQNLEPTSDSVSPSLSAPPPLTLFLSLKNK